MHSDLEQVGEWHGGVREAVDKERLQYPLSIVGSPADHGDAEGESHFTQRVAHSQSRLTALQEGWVQERRCCRTQGMVVGRRGGKPAGDLRTQPGTPECNAGVTGRGTGGWGWGWGGGTYCGPSKLRACGERTHDRSEGEEEDSHRQR